MDQFDKVLAKWQPTALSLFRFITGLLLFQYGVAKILKFPPNSQFAKVELMSLYGAAGSLELILGGLLIVGLFTRPVAFILSGEIGDAISPERMNATAREQADHQERAKHQFERAGRHDQRRDVGEIGQYRKLENLGDAVLKQQKPGEEAKQAERRRLPFRETLSNWSMSSPLFGQLEPSVTTLHGVGRLRVMPTQHL